MTALDVLAATAALRSAREAWPWLADLIEPGPVDRRRTRTLSPAAHARHDHLIRAERADRVANQRAGIKPAASSPVPIALHVVDVQAAALGAVVDQAWMVASAMRRQGWAYAYHHQTGPADWRWEATTVYLRLLLPHIPVPMAGKVGAEMERVDALIRGAAGVGPSWRTVHANCPACGVRVKAEVSDPDPAAWVVRCDNRECICIGLACDCKQPDRTQHWGRQHWWSGRDWAIEHGPLGLAIERGNAGIWRADGWYARPADLADELGVTEHRVRDWLRRSRRDDDRLRGMINVVSVGREVWGRLDDCAKVKRLVENSPRGRRLTEGAAA